MKTTYTTTIVGTGNHASIAIPDEQLQIIGGNKRAPLKITVNGYTYQSTATVFRGSCAVVFPQHDRTMAGVSSGETVDVTLELDSGYREVDIPTSLQTALQNEHLVNVFRDLIYSKRKEFARQVREAKAEDTRTRRIEKIILTLKQTS